MWREPWYCMNRRYAEYERTRSTREESKKRKNAQAVKGRDDGRQAEGDSVGAAR
jgi:hypothetical protein